MSISKELLGAVKVVQAECTSHDGCEDCTLRVELKDGTKPCAIRPKDNDSFPETWYVKELEDKENE